jgi:hypothetical protein
MESGFETPRPATTLYATVALFFVIPSEAEGSAVPRTLHGNFFFCSYWATIVTVTGMVCGGMQELESQAW